MWAKILANSGLAFFTTMSGILTADSILKTNFPLENILMTAVIVSSIQAAIAFFREILKENKEVEKELRKTKKGIVCWKTRTSSILENFVIF